MGGAVEGGGIGTGYTRAVIVLGRAEGEFRPSFVASSSMRTAPRPVGGRGAKAFHVSHGRQRPAGERRACVGGLVQHHIMRTTLTLDEDVARAARAMAAASGRRLGEVVSELMRRGLRPTPGSSTRSGLPVFRVDPAAEIIPADRAGDLLADER